MSWFKVDDKLWGHPKWLATPIRARGLWVTAGAWAADHEQDGRVPRHVLPILGGRPADAAALVKADLWATTDDGWIFHGWDEFQPTKAQKDADRADAAQRMADLRARKKEEQERRRAQEEEDRKRSEDVRPNIDEHDDMFGRSSDDVRSAPGSLYPDPTRPDPTRSTSGVLSVVRDGRDSSSSSPDVSRGAVNG